ncbi:hypothetical protein HYALB_00009151 [Hymenoscyphus albidus]|uniref:Peptidase A1 domain-containing protein n=1 Tax=Hymenoscyphus albidus TaxID=595503 RepID=A0A9N9Q7R0_9HELO|nr:hypothetical protein HYALB_00009151 [Hymenoscyphus albidus]
MFFILSVATLVSLASSHVFPQQTDTYHYMPVDFDYGADSRVTTNISFGTSRDAEPFKVVMDTGSADFWIWEPGAIVHWGSPYLGVIGPCNETVPTRYDPEKSTTAVIRDKASTYAYAGNSKIVSGSRYANDTITVPGGNGPIPNVQFALENTCLIRQRDGGSCSSISYDLGILGLSPNTETTSGPSFRQNLFDTGAIASKTMVMWFNKHIGSLGKLTGGILFGAIDRSKYIGPLVRVPNAITSGQVGYYVPKPLIYFNGQSFNGTADTNCLVDSGAHADYLPLGYGEQEREFAAKTGLVNYNGVVAYNGSCDSIPQDIAISYTFAGVDAKENVTIDIPLRNYARGAFGPEGLCLLNLEIGGCLLGAPFASSAFIAVDDGDRSIAFAQGGVSEEGSGVDGEKLVVIGAGESYDPK